MANTPKFWNNVRMFSSLHIGLFDLEHKWNMSDQIGLGLSDESFFKQAAQEVKMLRQPFFAQLFTLSSHGPYDLPSDRITISLSQDMPPYVRKYLTAINYTDRAIGSFLKELEQNGLLKNTVVVITGDHVGLYKIYRQEYEKYRSGEISQEYFVPLIILNAPQSLKVNKIMGQIDIYPTLLDVMGISDYPWRGFGTSILDPHHPGLAVSSDLNIIGEFQAGMYDYRLPWKISNIIIRKNYFSKKMGLRSIKAR